MLPHLSAMPSSDGPVDALLREAARGDDEATGRLLDLYRERLRRMVAYRLDAHLSAHLDASDVVQDVLTDAARKLRDYALKRPLPFYPWLHRLASERLLQARRRYRRVAKAVDWPGTSAGFLADRLVARDPTPGHALLLAERRQRVRDALERLTTADRDILIMRYLEDLTFPEIAAILDIAEGAAKMRHLRALQRIRTLIEDNGSESAP